MLGPYFEQLARDFTFKFASPATLGAEVSEVGAAIVNDPQARAQHELDVVATFRQSSGSTGLTAIGEAKHTNRMRTIADLNRLDGIRTLLMNRGQASRATKLLVFSASGFDRNLLNASYDRDDVELIDLDRMYRGT
ncbi:MAG TPA: hypothetical protein VM142_07280 [Acidimicrobiales bacterium]|nr:hypothetical protein [Acidimicrobiales bacterium]